MTYPFGPIAGTPLIEVGMIVRAARCWQEARSNAAPVLPALFATLEPARGILAPVFDSLLSLCEAALGRPLAMGAGETLSSDERLLLTMLDPQQELPPVATSRDGPAKVLAGALRSFRIMQRLAAA